MASTARIAVSMARANPVRTAAMALAPLLFGALQVYVGVTSPSPRSYVGFVFAAVLFAYTAGVFRIHIAHHRVELLSNSAPLR